MCLSGERAGRATHGGKCYEIVWGLFEDRLLKRRGYCFLTQRKSEDWVPKQ